MKTSCRFLPWLPAAALAACGTPTTASVQLDPNDGWSGTAEVLVHQRGGTMVSRTPITTSADVAIEDGDTVTVALHDAGKIALLSATRVQRGDAIEYEIGPLGATQLAPVTVNLPAVSGATSWELATSNSGASGDNLTSLSIDIPAGKTSVPILGTAESASGALAMYGEKNAPIDPSGASIALTDTIAWQPVTVTARNAPGGVGSTFVGGDVVLGRDQLSLASSGGTLAVPTSFGDRVDLTAFAFGPSEVDIAGASYAAVPNATTFDLSLPNLPAIFAPSLANGTLSWALIGTGAVTLIGLDLSSSTNSNVSWSIEAPPDTLALTLPQLPSDLGAPTAFDSYSIGVVSRSDLGSYGDALHVTEPPPAGSHFEERIIAGSRGSAAPLDCGKLWVRVPLAALRR